MMQTFYLYFRETALVGCRRLVVINRAVYNPATTLLSAAMNAIEAAHAGDHWFQWVNSRADQMQITEFLKFALGELITQDECLVAP